MIVSALHYAIILKTATPWLTQTEVWLDLVLIHVYVCQWRFKLIGDVIIKHNFT